MGNDVTDIAVEVSGQNVLVTKVRVDLPYAMSCCYPKRLIQACAEFPDLLVAPNLSRHLYPLLLIVAIEESVQS